MNSKLTPIPEEQLSHVSGGIGLFKLLELPHIFMGAVEFVNYLGDRWNNGCQNIEENDYFTRAICWLPNRITQEKPAQITVEVSA